MSEPNSMDTEMTTATDIPDDQVSAESGVSKPEVEENAAPAAEEAAAESSAMGEEPAGVDSAAEDVDSAAEDQVKTFASDDTVTDESVDDNESDINAEDDNAEDDNAADDDAADDDSVDEPTPVATRTGPIEIDEPEEEEIKLEWYILKVQSNRERSISEALRRKIAIEGLDDYFGEVLVPTEKVTEFKGGKKKVVQRKLWPGYIAVQMHVNDDTWFAIRETSGIGDFTGSGGSPTPMEPAEVAMILHKEEEETDEAPKLDIKFSPGDKVKVTDGNFENFEGEVSSIDETHGRVTVMLSIFGRPTPVELEYWQIEAV